MSALNFILRTNRYTTRTADVLEKLAPQKGVKRVTFLPNANDSDN